MRVKAMHHNFPMCEICEREIRTPMRYHLGDHVYVCPECMSTNLASLRGSLDQPVADVIEDTISDWKECNDVMF